MRTTTTRAAKSAHWGCTVKTDPQTSVRAAVLALDPTPDWGAILTLLEVDRRHRALHLLDGVVPQWLPAAKAARAALEVERQIGMDGLAELVVRHEALRQKMKVTA